MSLRQQIVIEDLVDAAAAIEAELNHLITKKGNGPRYQQYFQAMTTPRFPNAFAKFRRALAKGQAYLREPDPDTGVDIPY